MKRYNLIPHFLRYVSMTFVTNASYTFRKYMFATTLSEKNTAFLSTSPTQGSNAPLYTKHGKFKSTDTFDPKFLCSGTIPLPASLSPSSAAEFKACPQSFLFQYIYGIKLPTNPTLAKGTMCHKALEQIFELRPGDRTLENLQNLLRRNWAQQRLSDEFRHLFQSGTGDHKDMNDSENDRRDVDGEKDWGQSALKLLANYYALEDPRLVPRPNPIEREIWVSANLTVNPNHGVTGYISAAAPIPEDEHEETFFMRGIVDRLDVIVIPSNTTTNSKIRNSDATLALRIVDYKTGKAPDLKYSRAMNEKIADEALWQLKIYALLLREMCANGHCYSPTGNLNKASNVQLRFLRLMFLTSTTDNAKYIELDLGESQGERDVILHSIHTELANIWREIKELVNQQDAKAFVHCDRPWCSCHIIRGNFLPGSVWSQE